MVGNRHKQMPKCAGCVQLPTHHYFQLRSTGATSTDMKIINPLTRIHQLSIGSQGGTDADKHIHVGTAAVSA